MNIKLFTNIIKQFRDSKFRLIFEKSIFTFLRFHKGRSISGFEPTPVEYRPYTLPLCYGCLKSIQFNLQIN